MLSSFVNKYLSDRGSFSTSAYKTHSFGLNPLSNSGSKETFKPMTANTDYQTETANELPSATADEPLRGLPIKFPRRSIRKPNTAITGTVRETTNPSSVYPPDEIPETSFGLEQHEVAGNDAFRFQSCNHPLSRFVPQPDSLSLKGNDPRCNLRLRASVGRQSRETDKFEHSTAQPLTEEESIPMFET